MMATASRSESAEILTPSAALRHLSGNQERNWFLDQYEDDASVLYLNCVLRVRGNITDANIVEAMQRVIARHPVLRQRFTTTPNGTVCSVSGTDALHIDVVDVGNSDEELRKAVRRFLETRLDLRVGHSLAARLFRTESQRLLCVVAHPCVADADSLHILANEFVEETPGSLHDRNVVGAEFGYFERTELSVDGAQAAEQYWIDRVGIDPAPLELPRAAPRPSRKRFAAQSRYLTIDAPIVLAVELMCARLQVSFQDVCLAAYLALLRRWSQQVTVTVGRVTEGRTKSEARCVGPFENVVPVRVDFEPQSFASFMRALQARLAADVMHEGLPFDRIAKQLQKSRDPSRNPVFQAMFRFISYGAVQADSNGWSIAETREFERALTPCDLSLEVRREQSIATVRIAFDEETVDAQRIQRFGNHFVRFLSAIAADAETSIDGVPILDHDEIRRQLEVLNPAETSASGRTVLDMFQSAVVRFSEVPAVSFGRMKLSYGELDRQAEGIACVAPRSRSWARRLRRHLLRALDRNGRFGACGAQSGRRLRPDGSVVPN